ncbi:MAG: AAA family ATPase [Intestinibacter bartlettii]|uniref:AAA family ATPase n=1 Tax=Intestinibacter bartlettii TaxID=261299 RepID=UPI0026EE2049|nr:AAA family ATPase [Intestinibacter bartlettii]MDO5010326.1 AAA family ATPase [Intestinibacter bartlettii]
MNDFREVSTIELLYEATTNLENKMRKFEELFKKNTLKLTLKGDDKDKVNEFHKMDELEMKEKVEELTLSKLMECAQEGDVEAQYNLGVFHMFFDKDKLEGINNGFEWYKKAAENGLKEAQFNLACLYIDGINEDDDDEENEEKGFKWFQKSAEQGFVKSKLCLSLCYEHGIGVDIDKEKSFELLKEIEDEKNNYLIQFCLGVHYENGIGVQQDKKKAFEYYKTCANGGYDVGQLRTAICYEYGIGVKQDYKKAFNRYKKAVSNGNIDAKFLMARCYEFGIGINIDYKKAFMIYKELENENYEDGIYRLAHCYEHGIGVDIDKEKAFSLYNKLAKMGNQDAMFYLAQCYESDDKDYCNNEEIVADLEENESDDYGDVIVAEPDEDILDTDQICELEEDYESENEIVLSENLGINVFLEQKIFKQIKDNNLESDLKKLVIKIDKCFNSVNKSLNLNSLGFKKYGGVGDNKIYGFDFNNKVNDSDRIIACFVEDYAKKHEFDFERYTHTKNQNKQGIILFSIVKHNDQEREAIKVSKRMNSNFFKDYDLKVIKTRNDKTYKDILKARDAIKTNEENNMTFRAIDFDDDEIIYQEILTREQSKYIDIFIQKSEPFILSGIAGSGKTLSTVNLIPDMVQKIKNMNSDKKILYVTFSNNLKEYVKSKVMENYYELSEYIDIRTFEDICTEINYKHNNKKIDRSKIITQTSYNKNFNKFLNWLQQTSRDGSILKFIKKYENEKNIIYSEIFGILKGSMYIDWNRKEPNIVNKEYYINTSEEIVEDYKIFVPEEREILYSITEKYNEWLDENGYSDINDIAFQLQDLIKSKPINYEYVIVDEVQDFTEVQIYMLFLLAKEQEIYGKHKTRKILLAGDPNQIINPTFFKIGRLKKLFYIYEYEYKIKRLNENFRNSVNIMKMNNIVNQIINDKLPARKEEDKQYEVTKNNKTGIIEQVNATEDNLKIIFNGINTSAKVALIVSDDEKKEYLKETYGCKNAFTISEFKGKEFDNIIAYNILSDYADIYEKVYKTDVVKEGHYSYYFNRFYVSITRANYNLVLIEEKETEILNEIKEKMGDDLKYINSISEFKDLNLGEVVGNSIDLFNTGMDFFYDEQYSVAKNYFIRSVEPNSNSLANICDLFEEDGKYEEKGDKLFDIGQYKLAQSYYEKAYQFSKFAIMYLYRDDLSYKNQLKEFYNALENGGITFSDLFDEYGEKFNKLQDILTNKVIKTQKLSSEIQVSINNINDLFKNINGKMNGR